MSTIQAYQYSLTLYEYVHLYVYQVRRERQVHVVSRVMTVRKVQRVRKEPLVTPVLMVQWEPQVHREKRAILEVLYPQHSTSV